MYNKNAVPVISKQSRACNASVKVLLLKCSCEVITPKECCVTLSWKYSEQQKSFVPAVGILVSE